MSPLIDLEVECVWKVGDVWKVFIQFDISFSSDGTDYLALYDVSTDEVGTLYVFFYFCLNSPSLEHFLELSTAEGGFFKIMVLRYLVDLQNKKSAPVKAIGNKKRSLRPPKNNPLCISLINVSRGGMLKKGLP